MYLDTKLPTDSLYKFICILGLSVFLAGCLLYWNHYKSLVQSSIRAEGTLGSLAHSVELVVSGLNKNTQELDKLLSSISENNKNERRPIYEPKLEGLSFMEDPEFKDFLHDCENRVDDFCLASREYRAFRNIAYLIMAVGSLGMGAGIYLWYTRIQKYEDKIIRKHSMDEK